MSFSRVLIGARNQLRDLIDPKEQSDGTHTSLFTPAALHDILTAISQCRKVFRQLQDKLEVASRQVKNIPTSSKAKKIQLSRTEKAKWPFLQPEVDELRQTLRDKKSNLLLMVAVANLALANRPEPGRVINLQERMELKAAVVKLKRAEDADSEDLSDQEKDRGVKGLFKKVTSITKRNAVDLHQQVNLEKDEKLGERAISPASDGEGSGTKQKRGDVNDRTQKLDDKKKKKESTVHQSDSHIASDLELAQPNGTEKKAPSENEKGEVQPPSPNNPKSRKRSASPETIPPKDESKNSGKNASLNVRTVKVEPEKSTAISEGDKNKQKRTICEDLPEMDPAGALGALEVKDALRAAAIFPQSPAEEFIQKSVDFSPEIRRLREIPSPSPGIGPSKPPLVVEIPRVPVAVTFYEDPKRKSKEINNISPKSDKGKGKSTSQSGSSSPKTWDYVPPSFPRSSKSSKTAHRQIHAWTTAVLPNYSGLGAAVSIDQIHLPTNEVEKLIGEENNLVKSLSELNVFQRQLIMDHVKAIDSLLEYVQIWKHERITTVLGELELIVLLWVTTRIGVEELKFNNERFFSTRDSYRQGAQPSQGGQVHNHDNQSRRASDDEDYARRKMDQNYEANVKPVINFKDCVGRKFAFPFELVITWPVSFPVLFPRSAYIFGIIAF